MLFKSWLLLELWVNILTRAKKEINFYEMIHNQLTRRTKCSMLFLSIIFFLLCHPGNNIPSWLLDTYSIRFYATYSIGSDGQNQWHGLHLFYRIYSPHFRATCLPGICDQHNSEYDRQRLDTNKKYGETYGLVPCYMLSAVYVCRNVCSKLWR